MVQLVTMGKGMGPHAVATGGGPPPAFVPTDLGADLLAWWTTDAGVTEAAGVTTSWVDRVVAYDCTAAGTARPTYSATSYNGGPGITFDGTTDCMVLASQPFPSAAVGSEMWAVVDQTALVGDTNNRPIFSYGDVANTSRILRRAVVSGQNRIAFTTGTGAGTITGDLAADFSGRHTVRGLFTASETSVGMDGVMGTPTAGVPGTATARARIGAQALGTPTQFYQGVVRHVLVTRILSAGNTTNMWAWGATQL